ncbi:dTDP-glucose 4,6-dehydratase [Syntrophomonas wolfei]|uniref:Nucleoside-diphosphate-sugar epimerase n=1 Tax=Syntrophomonas wolfei subsp. wolfei (strain DSM 2245B / Goettingen) TaxID=335541 RepID=Q0B0C4_SYNWW|nr:SDR family NAD(P)-dependent oxidoreductase [Syntrophomonas wolfei]ABI67580.1 nucleoside-diphosphate-sugar epimerase [Syntrophomonas wolfei subsp. wolfei str. Goettingen G311]
MNILVTGGAGFIGRWVVKKLLAEGQRITALDDLSNGRLMNIDEFRDNPDFLFIEGDIKDRDTLKQVFAGGFDLVYHLAASINVQDSIDDPRTTYENDVTGTFNVLEECRRQNIKMLFMSTCMVYERSLDETGITEEHPVKPASPYAASKLAGEALTLSYYYAYGLPTVVVRPFNTYGPFQKSSGEGGVVAIFIQRELAGEELNIYGDGTQTRDLLYVEDCADFVVRAGRDSRANGQLLNAGLGRDVSINGLARMIGGDAGRIRHVAHIHPQSEIPKLLCNYDKARELLDWQPRVSLEEGLQRTREWMIVG